MLTLCLATLGGVAHADPRVALVVGEASRADAAIARASLASSGFDVVVVDSQSAPYTGELAALARARKDVRAAVEEARARFVETRYAEARAIANEGDRLAASFAGEPAVARALAELALVAAQCGDEAGYARAAARFSALELDEAHWSPTVRDAFARAVEGRARGRRVTLRVRQLPAEATLYVDGVARAEPELQLSPGAHALYVSAPGSMPRHEALRVDRPAELVVSLVPVTDPDRVGALRLRVGWTALSSTELEAVARQLGVDALVTLAVTGKVVAYAWPSAEGAVTEGGERGEAIASAAREAARRVRTAFSLSHTPPERARAGTPLELKVRAGASVHDVTLSFVTTPGHKWERRTSEVHDGEAAFLLGRAQLPSSDKPYLLEYYLSGRGEHGELAALRDATTPLRLPIEPDRERPHWYKKWWIWTVVGVVAAGAVTTAVVLTTRPVPDARIGGQ